MKKTMKTLMLAGLVGMSVAAFSPAHAADKAAYEALCKEVIAAAVMGDVTNVDALVAKLDQATNIGVEMAKEIAAKDAAGKPLLDLVVANVDKIKGADLESIEADWHHGKAIIDAGIDHDSFDHYGAVIGAKDAIIHPLTALVALKAYQADGDAEHLEQVQAELEEILGQLKFVN